MATACLSKDVGCEERGHGFQEVGHVKEAVVDANIALHGSKGLYGQALGHAC
jgi:hypothetical protein